MTGHSTRRKFLGASTVGLTGLIAGCSNGSDTEPVQSGRSTTDNANNAPPATTTSELRERVNALEGEVDTLENELNTKNQTVTTLRADLDTERQLVEDQKSEIDSLENDLENAGGDDQTERVSELESTISKQEQRIEELKSRNGSHQYSTGTRSKALEVGKDIREAVVLLRFH